MLSPVRVIQDGGLLIEQGRVLRAGPWSEVSRDLPAGIPVEDLGNALVFPGLVNAHCHLDYTDFAGKLIAPRSFADWIKAMLALKSAQSYTDYSFSWLRGAGMLVKHGVTSVLDIEAVPELLPDVLPATPLRITTCLEITGIRDNLDAEAVLAGAVRWLKAVGAGEGRLERHRPGLSPHALYSTRPELLALAAREARALSWPLTVHLAESQEEFDMFTRRQGPLWDWLHKQRNAGSELPGSPVSLAQRSGVLEARVIAAHVNFLAPGDARILAERGVSVVHCPRSHAYFGHRRFPLEELRGLGVRTCVGTDSLATVKGRPGSGLELDLFEELRVMSASWPSLSAEFLVGQVTTEPAAAMGLEGRAGTLEAGAFADLAVISHDGDASSSAQAVVGHRGPVSATMIDGVWVWGAGRGGV